MNIKMIVLTGGPCSGKTTVLNALAEKFTNQIIIVREIATMLIEGGFPLPGKDIEWCEEWQASFQEAILPLQKSMEETHILMARQRRCNLVVCDRGLLDGAAYTPGGFDEFCQRYGIKESNALARYDAVIHLESLAISNPKEYGKTMDITLQNRI